MKTPLARFSSLLFALGFLGVLTAADSPFTDGKWVDLTHEFSSDTLNIKRSTSPRFDLFQHAIKQNLGLFHLSDAHEFRKLLHLLCDQRRITSAAGKPLNACFHARQFLFESRLQGGRGVGFSQLLETSQLLGRKYIAQRKDETELLSFDLFFAVAHSVQLLQKGSFVRLLSIQQRHHRIPLFHERLLKFLKACLRFLHSGQNLQSLLVAQPDGFAMVENEIRWKEPLCQWVGRRSTGGARRI